MDIDGDPEIDPHLANRTAKIFEEIVAVAASVDRHDMPAAAQDHFVETEVVEVAAVREVHVGVGVRGVAERLSEKRKRRVCGASLIPCAGTGVAGVAEPPAEAHVEERQEK